MKNNNKRQMKKHLKKAATVLACTGMVAGAFTTTAFAEDAEQITLNVSHIFVDQTDGQCRGWYKALDEYKESHPNITIVEDTADNDAYKTKLKTQLAAGAVPDVFYAWGGGFTKPFVEAGMVENLDPYVEDGTIDLDAMMPDICNNFYYDGSLYGLPLDSFIGVLMCNQSLFDEYGLEIPKTMDDLYAVSATFNENGITPIAMGEKDKWPGLFPFGALALRYGGVLCLSGIVCLTGMDLEKESLLGFPITRKCFRIRCF